MSSVSLPRPRAILFDLDGTLADTAPDLAAAVNQLLIRHGREPVAYESLRPVASAGARGLIGVAFGLKPGDEGYEELRIAFLDNYAAAIATHTLLFEGIEDVLRDLEQRGIQWGIVTNKPGRYTEMLVPEIDLAHAACVISGDTTPNPKPHPAPLLEAARRMNLAPQECWYVGDDLRDIQAGQAAQMTTIAAAWGYCGNSEPVTWQAVAIASTPQDILKLIPG